MTRTAFPDVMPRAFQYHPYRLQLYIGLLATAILANASLAEAPLSRTDESASAKTNAGAKKAELKLKQVSLYSSGKGAFAYSGEVSGESVFSLSIREEE